MSSQEVSTAMALASLSISTAPRPIGLSKGWGSHATRKSYASLSSLTNSAATERRGSFEEKDSPRTLDTEDNWGYFVVMDTF